MELSKDPLVSVVIPMYNAEDWIEGLLESIQRQTYSKIEIILVDDGSTDLSLKLVTKFSSHNSEIALKVISKTNSGVSDSRNEGVRQATGELVAFVDSDDIWMAEKIERQVDSILSSNAAAVACSYVIFRDSDQKLLDVIHPKWSAKSVRNWLLFRSYGGLLSSTLMISKDTFYQTGPFRSDLSLSADVEFAWRLLRITSVEVLNDPLVGYRLRANQMHKIPSLLLSESQRMIEIVDLLKIEKYRNIYIANLNLRLFLYSVKDGQIRNSLGFLLNALRMNILEIYVTFGRILLKRALRVFREKKSFFPNP